MGLKAIVGNIEDIPEEFRPLYVERDGKHHLDVEGFDDPAALKSALQKERSARTKAEQAARQLAERYQDVDLDDVKRLQEAERQRKDGELISAGKVEELVNERIKRVQTEFEKAKAQLEAEKQTAREQLSRLSVDNEVVRLAPELGFHPAFNDYLTWLARQTFRPDEHGVQRAYSGETPLYSAKDATQPLGIKEWLGDLAGRATHLLSPSSGAPAQPTGGKGGKPSKPVGEWTQSEKDEYIGQHGAEAYGQLWAKSVADSRARARAIH